MTEQDKIKEAFKTIAEMCSKTPCKQCPMSYCDSEGDYMCSFERRPPHSCELREVKVFEPHWEEFDVVDGYFSVPELEADYPYYNYIQFLNESKKHNVFGGWFYVTSKQSLWVTVPLIEDEYCLPRSALESDYGNMLIPTKIRFWRFRE